MNTLVFRQVPDGLYRRLNAVAKEHRRSMNQEAILALETGLPGEPIPQRPTLEESKRWLEQMVWSLPVQDDRSAEEFLGYGDTKRWLQEQIESLIAPGGLGYLWCIDAGQADRDQPLAALHPQGVAVSDREHRGSVGPPASRRTGPVIAAAEASTQATRQQLSLAPVLWAIGRRPMWWRLSTGCGSSP